MPLAVTISIHTSAKEVTNQLIQRRMYYEISIHTSAKEVTAIEVIPLTKLVISIHTSAKEVTWSRRRRWYT